MFARSRLNKYRHSMTGQDIMGFKHLLLASAIALLPLTQLAAQSTVGGASSAINVKDRGAKGDATITSTTVTMTVSSADLVTGAALFTPASVGKTIIVGNAGTAPTSGLVAATPVSTSGSGYTAVPACAITDGSSSGSGATCSPLMAVVSATVASGGSGCTNGTATFLVGIDGSGTPAQVTGTVSGNSLSGALTITTAGLYTTLPTLAGATAYGNACATPPTINLTMGVGAVQVTAQGSNYSTTQTTAGLSGGSPSVAATMGSVQFNAITPPLKTTIASYISPTHVTLAASAGSTLTAATEQVLVGTDDSAAFQAAINAGAGIYIPPGTYWIGASLDPGRVARTVRGEGKYNTILVYDGGTAAPQGDPGHTPLFVNRNGSAGSPTGSLQFTNFQVRGLLDFGRANLGAPALELNNYVNIDLSNLRFYQIQNMAMANESIRRFSVLNSEFDTVMRDQARCRSCFAVRIIGNYFVHSDDDSVAVHQASYINGPGIIGEGVVVQGNDFEDTTGVHILHAWKASIVGNTFRRTKIQAISISNTSQEATSPQLGIVIADNQITDSLDRPPFAGVQPAAISASYLPSAYVTGDTTVLPGSPIYGTTVVAKPWNYSTSSLYGGTAPAPPARGVDIHDNTYLRTLPAVAHYSDWGYGPVFSNAGFIDVPVPEAAMVPTTAISASVNTPGLLIHNNSVSNIRRGISVIDNAFASSQVRMDIAHNNIYDAWEYGVALFGTGVANHVALIGNQIDVDPYQVSPGRSGGHGGWSNNYSASRCFYSGLTMTSFTMAENEFANCYSITQPTYGIYYGNVVHGRPATGASGQLSAWSSVNYGMGVFPSMGGPAFTIVNTNSDPTGQLPTQFENGSVSRATYAAAAPTSGYHVINEIVWSTAPATCGCVGWLILTTGTGWVSGTDYKIIPIS
jgi:hypothetical protein